jgi:acyl carrier protein
MTDQQIVDLVKGALTKARPDQHAEFRSIGIDTRFESLPIDSIASVQMIIFMEDALGIIFREEDLGQMEAVKDVVRLIHERTRGGE